MTDPYLVLGVAHSATDDEVKKSYRQLCKQYHPDLNPDNPSAEEKFKEVQAAYEEVMRQRTGGGGGDSYYGSTDSGSYRQQQARRTQNGYSYGYKDPFSGFGFDFDDFFGGAGQQAYSDQNETTVMQAARNYINSHHYSEALNALNMVAENDRDARWYYYSALANIGLGNKVNALENAHKAVQMEPNNAEYSQLLQQLQSGSYGYTQRQQNYAQPMFNFGGCGRWAALMVFFNCCCGGGGRFFCC